MSMPGNVNLALAGGTPAPLSRHPARRSALAAAVLSLLMPGVGHVYVGRVLRGFAMFGILLLAQAVVLIKFASTQPRFLPIEVVPVV